MKISPARVSAFEILCKIETDKAFSAALLPVREARLEPKDRGLCHELTLGVLRRQILLDRLIDILTAGKKIDPTVRIILRIALYQLKFLDKIPAHAALNDAVNLVQKAKKTSAKGFVNAILRKFQRENPDLSFADEIEKLSVETSHPRWLIEKWISQFGFVETVKLASVNNETPETVYRWTAKTTEAVKKSLAKDHIEDKTNFLRELAENGKIYFQDRGSQLIADAVDLKNDESFLDVCAAPGSKITQIASQNAHRANLTGGDLHWPRVKLLKENCRRQGVGFVNVLQYNAEKSLPFTEESFEVILVDAPCSGTGTIRHNPEIRYFLEKKDFAQLAAKQLTLLENASKLIKHGGRLIYSTCSLEIEENEEVCRRFADLNPEFSAVKPNLPENFLTGRNFARTFPPQDKMDGFFIAVFAKK